MIAWASDPVPARERAPERRSSGSRPVVSIRSATSCGIALPEIPARAGTRARRSAAFFLTVVRAGSSQRLKLVELHLNGYRPPAVHP